MLALAGETDAGSAGEHPVMPSKTPACPTQASLLSPRELCPLHAEPEHGRHLLGRACARTGRQMPPLAAELCTRTANTFGLP